MNFRVYILLAALLLCPRPALAADSCAATPAYHRLDFWLGAWTVYDAKGNKAGTDVVTSILKGCALSENWTDVDGSQGLGIMYYNGVTNQWTKLYLSDAATERGGIRERVLVAEYPDGAVRFQGVIPGPAGSRRVMNRTTIRPLPDGRIHYTVASSTDGGEVWADTFDVFYVRSQPAPH